MSASILQIEITFPVAVEVSDETYQRLCSLVNEICEAYEAAHPDRVMWPSGFGSKITYMPITRQQELERGVEFDPDTMVIACAERERYHRWFFPKGIKYECCRDCGIVKRADDKNGPCRGKVRVELREAKSP